MQPSSIARALASAGLAAAAVALATLAIAGLEHLLGVPNAAAVYLVAVSAVAIAAGTWGAVLAALIAVLVYDYFFTLPFHTLTVADPGELLNLVLLLFVAVTVGQLASLQRGRAEVAEAREREARALVEVTSLLAGRQTTRQVLPAIAAVLASEPGMGRTLISLGPDDASERVAADSGQGESPRRSGSHAILHRGAGGRPPAWTQIREVGVREASRSLARHERDRRFRVRIESGGRAHGSIWSVRPDRAGSPGSATTRLLAVTADQVGLALEHDRLEEEARRAEIARQSDQLKSALLDSVSHDLRTPLASIRAYAGTLMDEDLHLSPKESKSSAAAIDREAQRLNRIVANLLDLSRIEGGALRARCEMLDLDEAVDRAIHQLGQRLGSRIVRLDVPADLAVAGDPVLLDEALVNLLENAAAHTPDGTLVAVSARALGEAMVRLTVEDSGPGVPAEALPHLFDRFFQAQRGTPEAAGRPGGPMVRRREGLGIGLAVVRGLVEALGGAASARRSELGGLAIDLDLPAAGVLASPLEAVR